METQLLSDRFIYSNSYYSTNVLKTQKGRFKPANNETNFLSFDASYDKVNGFSRPKRKCYNETWDNIHFQKACQLAIYNHNFYLSPVRVIYQFQIHFYINLLAQIGGLIKACVFLIGILVYLLNERNMIFKQIRNMYFVKDDNNQRSQSDYNFEEIFYQKLRVVNFGKYAQFTNLRLICCRRKNNKKCNKIEKTLNVGETKLQDESNIFSIL